MHGWTEGGLVSQGLLLSCVSLGPHYALLSSQKYEILQNIEADGSIKRKGIIQINDRIIEINRTNPLGMKGEMAEEFGHTMQNLWCGKYNYIIANKLRVSF